MQRAIKGIGRLAAIVSLLVVILIVGLAGELFRGEIASVFWHWRHGNSIDLAQYELSVPKSWFVDSYTGSIVELGRAHIPSFRGSSFESRLTVSVSPSPLPSLEFWETKEQAFYDKEGATILRRREIPLGSQYHIVCIEGNLVRDALKLKHSDLISADCQSDNRLSLMFTGTEKDMQEFYTVTRSIRLVR